MAYTLTLDDMANALDQLGDESAAGFKAAIRGIGDAMAVRLCDHLDLGCRPTFNGDEMTNAGAQFFPLTIGQTLPDVFDGFDDAGEWEDSLASLGNAGGDVCAHCGEDAQDGSGTCITCGEPFNGEETEGGDSHDSGLTGIVWTVTGPKSYTLEGVGPLGTVWELSFDDVGADETAHGCAGCVAHSYAIREGLLSQYVTEGEHSWPALTAANGHRRMTCGDIMRADDPAALWAFSQSFDVANLAKD